MVPQDLIAWESILAQSFAPSSPAEAVAPAGTQRRPQELKHQKHRGSRAAVAHLLLPLRPPHPGAHGVQAVRSRSAELDRLVGFKVSRAMAAAVLDPLATAEATLLQSKLQPLKYQHFSKRALYMARRVGSRSWC